MTIDEYGIVRDGDGAKVAVFRDVEAGRRFIELSQLVTPSQSIEMVASGNRCRFQRVTMWRVCDVD